jgi:hypothetical protein
MNWNQVGVLVGVLSPLVGVPLVMITFYLRTIRDHQTHTMAEIGRRIDTIETSIRGLLKRTATFDREYATKEEWIRESMLARQRLEHLTELVTRIEAELDTGQCLASEIGRASTAMLEMVRRLTEPGGREAKE